MRLLSAVLLALAVAASWAPGAQAEDEPPAAARSAVVVLDRGADARKGSAFDAANALRIWKSLEAQGVATRLLAAGIRNSGATELADVPPTRAGLAALAQDARYAFAGPTDVRAALAWALESAPTGPVDLVLLGPWSPTSKPKTRDSKKAKGEDADPLAGTIARWNAKAPKGSRVLSVGAGPGRAVLKDARGFAGDGRLVIGFSKPEATTKGFSPLPRVGQPAALLEATVQIIGDLLRMGPRARGTEQGAPALRARSDITEDELTTTATAGLHKVVVGRRPIDGRTVTITFQRATAKDLHWLAPAPEALTLRWDKLAPDARLVGPDEAAVPTFTAVDVAAGAPVSVSYRLLRTLAGRTPAWKVAAEAGKLPPGLTVGIGDEVRTTPEIAETEIRVVFTPAAGKPLEAQGVITLSADGMPEVLRLPFEIRVPQGRATLRAQVRDAALPPAAADKLTTISVVAENANVPAAIQIVARCDGGQERWLRARVTSPGGDVATWRLDKALVLDVGVERTLAFDVLPGSPVELAWPCLVTLTPKAIDGMALSGEAVITIRQRRPRIVLIGTAPEYRLEDETIVADTPLVLQLDADGGDGDWLLALRSVAPSVRQSGEAPIGWQAVTRGEGMWHLVPTGRWSGPTPSIFSPREVPLELEISWSEGGAPGKVGIPVNVPARWGKRGFLLVALAAMALLIALMTMTFMRTPPVSGTLLYTIDGLGGAVGRLDLAPVGRRVRTITADEKGRLSIAGGGEVIGKIRPTRVGGMLEYADAMGSRERRLLVDGLSLRTDRHLVRYVSGRAAAAADAPLDVPDLLGPEYDIETGRVGDSGDEASGGQAAPGAQGD